MKVINFATSKCHSQPNKHAASAVKAIGHGRWPTVLLKGAFHSVGVESEPLAVVTQFQVEKDKRGRGTNKKWDWAKDCTHLVFKPKTFTM